ncbi:hypothetical protein D3C81_1268230 [compost metagenome]
MTGVTTISIDDDFTSGQTGIPLRPANHEPTRWVNKIFRIPVQQLGWNNGKNHLFLNILLDLLQTDLFGMLRGYDDRVHSIWLAVNIFNRHLRFAIGTKIFQRAVLAHFRQTACDPVRKCNWKRHQFRRFIRCKPEHQALVAGPDIFSFLIDLSRIPMLQSGIHALRDVSRLLV